MSAPKESRPFVRSAGAEARNDAVAADVKDGGPFLLKVVEIHEALRSLGLKPGESMPLNVGQQPMVLWRTRADDAFVLQTPGDFGNRLFNGLYIDDHLGIKLNGNAVRTRTSRDQEAWDRLFALSDALGIPHTNEQYS